MSAGGDAEHLFAGLRVADLAVAREFYERLLGRPPDLVPNRTEAAWRLTGSGWICLYEEPGEPVGSAPTTLLVAGLDAFLAAAAARGIELGPVRTLGSGARQSVIVDPDGNRLKAAEAG